MAVQLDKIVLAKQGDKKTINLSKDSSGTLLGKEITINLNWTREPNRASSGGFFSSLKKTLGLESAIDLDLGCFYELKNGTKRVIDGLQFAQGKGGPRDRLTNQGRYTAEPWVWHTGDDRSGTGEGENILVNPQGLSQLKRLVVYCFIYEGVAKWDQTNAIATIKVPGNPDIIVEMGVQASTKMMCALAEITAESSDALSVKRWVTFHDGHEDCDRAFGWGMNWVSGSK